MHMLLNMSTLCRLSIRLNSSKAVVEVRKDDKEYRVQDYTQIRWLQSMSDFSKKFISKCP